MKIAEGRFGRTGVCAVVQELNPFYRRGESGGADGDGSGDELTSGRYTAAIDLADGRYAVITID